MGKGSSRKYFRFYLSVHSSFSSFVNDMWNMLKYNVFSLWVFTLFPDQFVVFVLGFGGDSFPVTVIHQGLDQCMELFPVSYSYTCISNCSWKLSDLFNCPLAALCTKLFKLELCFLTEGISRKNFLVFCLMVQYLLILKDLFNEKSKYFVLFIGYWSLTWTELFAKENIGFLIRSFNMHAGDMDTPIISDHTHWNLNRRFPGFTFILKSHVWSLQNWYSKEQYSSLIKREGNIEREEQIE